MRLQWVTTKQSAKNKNGFTILEMAVVTAVLGIILLYTIPSLKETLSSHALYASARQMAEDIRYHQQGAISAEPENSTYQVSFDVSRDEYSLQEGAKNLHIVALPSTVDLEEVTFSNRLLKFSIQGVPVEAGNIRLVDRLTQKGCYVIINPVVGRVRVDNKLPGI